MRMCLIRHMIHFDLPDKREEVKEGLRTSLHLKDARRKGSCFAGDPQSLHLDLLLVLLCDHMLLEKQKLGQTNYPGQVHH